LDKTKYPDMVVRDPIVNPEGFGDRFLNLNSINRSKIISIKRAPK
jgi:hypothetical protein